MQTTNFWNLYHLSSKKIILTTILMVMAGSLFAQNNIVKHDAKREKNGYSYGIHLGVTQHNFRVEHSDSFLNQNDILGVEGDSQTGIAIGIIGALHPSEDFEVRAIPTINFGNQNLLYTLPDLDKKAQHQGESTIFELPVQLKYKSQPYKDFRMFLIGGGMFRNNFSASKNEEDDLQTVIYNQTDYAVEFGGGMEFHFPYFVLAPELTITQGFGNQLKSQNTIYSNVIGSLNSRVYSLSINIE